MIGPVFARELRDYARNTRFRALFFCLILLCAFASFDGWRRASQTQEVRAFAEQSDRHNWLEQGSKNPHGAAHFSRYAFRSTPALAALDPGVWDYAGAAVWMEAHYQNPATLRRAEDALGRAPLSSLSIAWITRCIGSLALLVLLFPSVARERERKTLRALAAAGLSNRSFVLGKLAAASVATLSLVAVAFAVALVPALLLGVEPDLGRVACMFVASALAMVAFAMSVMAISAKSTSSGSAMVVGGVLWLVWAVALPTLSAQLSTSLYPDTDEHAFKSIIQKEAQSAFWSGPAKDAAIAELTQEILAQRGAKSLEDLNFNEKGLMLQAHERYANQVFDRRFGELYAQHRRQDGVIAVAAFASPLLALSRVTAGLAGTDLLAQQRFCAQAEVHRRKIIAQLNQDLMVNGADKGMKYEADRTLWEMIADFVEKPPAFVEVLEHYRFEFATLVGWLLLSSVCAFRFVGAAMRVEERS